MFNFSPKNDKFYDLFIEFTSIIEEASNELTLLSRNVENAEDISLRLKDIEHKGDDLVHKILQELNNSFITPLDREDILLIVKRLDDVVDNIEDIAGRYLMYDIKTSREKSYTIVDLLDESCKKMKDLFIKLQNFKTDDSIYKVISELNLLETKGDYAYRDGMRELFTTEVNNIEIIVWKDLYEKLEKTLDSCETLANVVEGVVMKHA